MENAAKGTNADEIPSPSDREQSIKRVCSPLPGSVPYDNLRPISVPQRCNAMTTMQWLAEMHTHHTMEQWRADIAMGLLRQSSSDARQGSNDGSNEATGDALTESDTVFAGQRFLHLMPDTVEPEVNADIRILFEDESLLVINKPAPLPIHPCGRFNRNSLTTILESAFEDETEFRIVHRLDASTTGLLVLCKTRSAAADLSQQFKKNVVDKLYLARVEGIVQEESFSCDEPITDKPGKLGMRTNDSHGSKSHTDFRLVKQFTDGTSLVQAKPITGRTNQIRIHLETLGFPICGDGIYNGEASSFEQRSKTNAVSDPPLCLHALSITLTHPTIQKRCTWTTEAPEWASGKCSRAVPE